MEIKYTKILNISSIINILIGFFLIICGLLEFIGIIKTEAATEISSGGIQLSYLVFVGAVLVFVCGLTTLLNIKTMRKAALQLILAICALAWPIFVSIALFFAQNLICIRLLPTMMASLFYIICLIIVLISNDSIEKNKVKISPSEHIAALGKSAHRVNVMGALKPSGKKTSHNIDISSIGNKINISKKHKRGFSICSGSRRRGHFNIKHIGRIFSRRH